MNNEKALVTLEATQATQVVTVSDVSAAEIEYQKMLVQYKELLRQTKELKGYHDVTFLGLAKAWFTENYPDVLYHIDLTDRGDERMVVFGASVHIETPGYSMAGTEFCQYVEALMDRLF